MVLRIVLSISMCSQFRRELADSARTIRATSRWAQTSRRSKRSAERVWSARWSQATARAKRRSPSPIYWASLKCDSTLRATTRSSTPRSLTSSKSPEYPNTRICKFIVREYLSLSFSEFTVSLNLLTELIVTPSHSPCSPEATSLWEAGNGRSAVCMFPSFKLRDAFESSGSGYLRRDADGRFVRDSSVSNPNQVQSAVQIFTISISIFTNMRRTVYSNVQLYILVHCIYELYKL